jgi:transposase InsO family protein
MMNSYYSCAELAALKLPGHPTAKKNWLALVERESWESRPRSGRGGGNEFIPPAPVQRLIATHYKLHTKTREQQMLDALVATLSDFQASEEEAKQARHSKAEVALRNLAGGLSEHEALTLKAHCEIAQGWQVWFVKAQPLRRSASWAPYANAYNLREVPITQAIRAAFPEVSARSVQRWVYEYEAGNLQALVDRRNGAATRGKSLFNAVPLLAAAATRMLLDKPGIRTQQLHQLLATAARDAGTGAALFQPPSYDQVMRFQRAWIAEHQDLYLQATNPDAWKNQSMLAFGSRSQDVTALNGRWELDATPADWLLLDADGKKRRYTVSVIVDVWSRRLLVVVSRTPKTVTHCLALRAALLAWGVPKEIVTDNGADYVSEHFCRVLVALGIEHHRTQPFSPEEKPHVERAIKTLNHSILELLPAFAGHSVADRKAIEARRSFADRLTKRGELVDFAEAAALTDAALQATIGQWLAGIYEQRPHGALSMSPFAKAASWTGEVRRIDDERSLDILLARPTSGGTRTLQKKGIALDGTWFIAPELARIDMGSTLELYETPDLGRVVVYYRKNFLCIAEAPERTGVDRTAIAERASALQKERLREQKAAVKALTKGTASTDDVLKRHLEESAEAAGKLLHAPFGAKKHHSDGLTQAAAARAALEGPKPSSRAAEFSALAAKAMADAPTNIIAHPGAQAHATPLSGLTNAEKYTLWGQYDALVKAHGGDVETLEAPWQRRFYVGFPTTPIYRAEANLAKARKETGAR